jgi:transcriptional regulator with XRE-family HTH domain
MIDLRLARFHRGLDLATVAAELQISRSYLSLIERRLAVPAAPIAKRIAEPATDPEPDREAA